MSLTIITFHRVTISSARGDAYSVRGLTCSIRDVRSIVSHLSQSLRPTTLRDSITDGKVRSCQNTFAITFDDGFREHAEIVAPQLASLGLQATFFVCSEYTTNVETVRPLDYFYHMEDLARSRKVDFENVCADVRNLRATSDIASCESDVAKTLRHRTWEEIGADLVAISEAHGIGIDPRDLNSQLYLHYDDIRHLRCLGMDIGAHSSTHRPLSALSLAEQRIEVCGSIALVKELSGQSDVAFAFPFGGVGSFNDVNISSCRLGGAFCACTTSKGQNDTGDDAYDLKRIDVSSGSLLFGEEQ